MAQPPRTGARVATLAAVLILLTVGLAAPALADHVYSHRYLTYGRVVDKDGLPVKGASVKIELLNFDLNLGYCGQDSVLITTDELGNFYQCNHIDTSIPGGAEVKVTVEGVTQTQKANANERESFFVIQLDRNATVDPATLAKWSRHYSVRGVVWKQIIGRTSLEQISVNGLTAGNVSVDVRLDYNGKTLYGHTRTSREYGWYLVEFDNLTEAPKTGTVTVTSEGVTVTTPIDPVGRYSHVLVDLPRELAGYIKWTGIIGGTIVGLAVVGGGGAWAWSRYSDARDIARARERTTRKRANK
jgi:hypothetical protein